METKSPTLYEYRSAKRYLLDFLAERQRSEPGFSVRKWAIEMGLSSNALLVMLLQGKRSIRVQHAAFLSKGLKLSSQESLYFQALIQYENSVTAEEKELCSLWLASLYPGEGFKIKEVEEHHIIAQWIHSALLTLTGLPQFDGSAESAYALLGKKASLPEIRAARERLLDLGYLEQNSEGKLSTPFQTTTTKDDVASSAVRKHHRQALALAEQAIEGVHVEKREFRSCSLVVDEDKIDLAKEMIRKFQAQFSQAMGESPRPEGAVRRKQAYQLNVQFFQLTESPGASPEDEGVDTGYPQPTKNKGVQYVE